MVMYGWKLLLQIIRTVPHCYECMTHSRIMRLLAILLVSIGTVGCDQTTKHIARIELSASRSQRSLCGLVEFTLAENPGAFLSLGASLSKTLRRAVFTVSVSLGLAASLAYLLRSSKLQLFSFFGLAWIIAGGTSNLIDRLTRHGLVTDFMLIRVGPLQTGVFNLADVAIVAGALALVVQYTIRGDIYSTKWIKYAPKK
jgi:signal peptidase II